MRWITHIEGGPKRVNHAAVTVGHKIYSFGGYCKGESSREYTSIDVHVLNAATFRWTKHPVSDLPYLENDDIVPYKRYGHTAVVYKDKIYIWGGRNDQTSCAVLFCLDTRYHCWTAPQTTGDIPLARDGHTACVWKHYMYIFGGFEEESDSFAKSIHVLNLETMQWRYIHTIGFEPAVRDFHTAVSIRDRMYIFGGRGTESRDSLYLPGKEIYCDELWYFDLQTHMWHNPYTTGTKPIGRRSHSAFVYNDKMYIFGGYNALKFEHYNDLFEYDPVLSEWNLLKMQGESPCNRRRQACIVVDDRVFLFGGTRITQDAYQTAKIGTLLTLFDNGKGEQYRKKDLAEVDIDPNIILAECDYDSENENHPPIQSNNFDITQNVTQSNDKETEVLNEEKSINRKRKSNRIRWTAQQKKIVTSHFKYNIKEKIAPKKLECENLIQKHEDILGNLDWVKVKTFIYNMYKNN